MPYTISEAAARMHLSAPTLRYYDKEGLLPFVDRSASGVRVFKESDFEWLRLIECLKATGMPIRDIKQFIDWCLEGDATLPQRRDMFRERRRAVLAQMERLQATLDIIDYKCWYYDQAIEKNDEAYVQALSFNQFPPQIQQYYKHSHEDC